MAHAKIINPQMVTLDGRAIRKFIQVMKKKGAVITETPISKVISDSEGTRIFSALKFSTGWSCLIAENFMSDLKATFAGYQNV